MVAAQVGGLPEIVVDARMASSPAAAMRRLCSWSSPGRLAGIAPSRPAASSGGTRLTPPVRSNRLEDAISPPMDLGA
jgi:hypothetical protein